MYQINQINIIFLNFFLIKTVKKFFFHIFEKKKYLCWILLGAAAGFEIFAGLKRP